MVQWLTQASSWGRLWRRRDCRCWWQHSPTHCSPPDHSAPCSWLHHWWSAWQHFLTSWVSSHSTHSQLSRDKHWIKNIYIFNKIIFQCLPRQEPGSTLVKGYLRDRVGVTSQSLDDDLLLQVPQHNASWSNGQQSLVDRETGDRSVELGLGDGGDVGVSWSQLQDVNIAIVTASVENIVAAPAETQHLSQGSYI